jgi:hypothetical protein
MPICRYFKSRGPDSTGDPSLRGKDKGGTRVHSRARAGTFFLEIGRFHPLPDGRACPQLTSLSPQLGRSEASTRFPAPRPPLAERIGPTLPNHSRSRPSGGRRKQREMAEMRREAVGGALHSSPYQATQVTDLQGFSSRRPDSNRGPLHYEFRAAVTTSHQEVTSGHSPRRFAGTGDDSTTGDDNPVDPW